MRNSKQYNHDTNKPSGRHIPEALKQDRKNNQDKKPKQTPSNQPIKETDIPLTTTVFFLWLLITGTLIPSVNTPKTKNKNLFFANQKKSEGYDNHLIISDNYQPLPQSYQRDFEITTQIGLIKSNEKINNQTVFILPKNLPCQPNRRGGIDGKKICSFMKNKSNVEATFFLKPISSPDIFPQSNYEAFATQLVINNIGALSPEKYFLKETDQQNESIYYIGSQQVKDLSIKKNRSSGRTLDNIEIAKLFVSATFVNDLHNRNWGSVKDQNGISRIVLIDVDSANHPLTDIRDYLLNMRSSLIFKLPPLSSAVLKQMIKLYEHMKTLHLPKGHDSFHLSYERYHELINTFQKACKKTLDKTNYSILDIINKDAFNINKIFCFEITNILSKNSTLKDNLCSYSAIL